jgi:hypothetical protein
MTRIRLATHVHSEWSYDGSFTLEQIGRAFGRRGYAAVLLAEHDRGFDEARLEEYRAHCAAASRSGPLLVPGIEYSDRTGAVHVPVWGARPFLGEGLETAELLLRVQSEGGLAILAHPARRNAVERLDPGLLRHLIGIELWNRKYDGYAPSRVGAELLARRPELLPFVSLDFHTARQFFPLAMALELDGEPTVTAVLDGLRQRRVRPIAFRLPAERFTRARAWTAMREAECARRRIATALRRLERAF